MLDRSSLRWIIPFTAIATIAILSPARADEQAKPNTLTPKEIEKGWLLLFDGETTFGWKVDGDAKVEKGVLILGGAKQTTITTMTPFGVAELELECLQGEGKLHFHNEHNLSTGSGGKKLLHKLSQAQCGESYYVFFACCGNSIGDFAGYSYSLDARPTTSPVQITVPAGKTLQLQNIKLRPGEMQPVFNGKDLTGWKVFPGERYKSHFSVTNEGWLNVKNGPGDLQTDGQYDDFILQLECISNGKALNSGVFFRCVAGQYQNGYEAQIQNGYKDGDRTRPVDYGTGAIYRRVPARKVVSNDHEWFTMTVAAQGKHIATWVNGYQTVDWTDERQPNDNPRNGSKTGKGHISIQGHDPTTDLSFRKIRIAEMPKDK